MTTKTHMLDMWPSLPYEDIMPTVDHVHRLAQIGGKYTLDQPFQANWGSIPLPITPRGFATPVLWCGDVPFSVEYELLDDRVTVTASSGRATLPLVPGSVADFYARFVDAVAPLGIDTPRTTIETEIPNAPHFDVDGEVRPYDSAVVCRVWTALASVGRSLTAWQASYRGPRPAVGIMWGGFDLFAARYNGREVEPPSTAPIFQQNGMMAEVVAVGLDLGSERSRAASLFAYVSPPPPGIQTAKFGVEGAVYNTSTGLITLPWETVRSSADPHATVLAFADGVYAVAVKLGGWPGEWVGPRVDGWYASAHRLSST